MEYREYGITGKKLSAISFGANRFDSKDLKDSEGIKKCVGLVLKAAKLGINYFDVAHYYSEGKCEEIFKIAYKEMRETGIDYYSCAKSGSNTDKNADAVLKRVELSLKNLGVDKIDFFYMWGILDENHYKDIMKKNGAYQGAVKAKNLGLIDHIVFSNHTNPDTAVKIINDGGFEGITLSYSVINHKAMEKVLAAAKNHNMGIAVMNPLLGGLIPQNAEYFAKLMGIPKIEVVNEVHKFIYSHKEITTIISGIENETQLKSGILGISSNYHTKFYNDDDLSKIDSLKLCTGCNYCKDCPKSIPISVLLQSYNRMLLKENNHIGYKDTQAHFAFTKQLTAYYNYLPKEDKNPCTECKKCEKACTQHIPIIKRLKEVYEIIERCGVSQNRHKERLDALLNNKPYKKVGIYTAGGYTDYVIAEYTEFFGTPKFEIMIFDKNKQLAGKELSGYKIYNADDIASIKPQVILIPSYRYGEEIYEELKKYEGRGIELKKLHKENDVPWVY